MDEAIDFLRRHQPMPPDEAIDDTLIAEYEAARQVLLSETDERVVPLVLGSFGPGFGHGVFQMMDEVVRRYPPALVVPALDEALANPSPGRWWVLQMALDFPDRRLAPHYKRLLASDHRDERFFAAADLEDVYNPAEDEDAVRAALRTERDPEIVDVLKNILAE
jgi:hypothetical protein